MVRFGTPVRYSQRLRLSCMRVAEAAKDCYLLVLGRRAISTPANLQSMSEAADQDWRLVSLRCPDRTRSREG